MATATLPYPNLDFTPLDILTASELDQMVANDKYLANFCNGLAKGTNIENGVIQSRHISWSGMTNGSSYIKLGSILICFGSINVNFSGQAYSGESYGKVNFPTKFKSAPKLVLSRSDSPANVGEYVSYSGLSASEFTYWAGQTLAGASTSGTITYIAIGIAP